MLVASRWDSNGPLSGAFARKCEPTTGASDHSQRLLKEQDGLQGEYRGDCQ